MEDHQKKVLLKSMMIFQILTKCVCVLPGFDLDVSENSGTPKSSILTGFSIIFTIHFGVPLFLETPIWSS